jgi:hypothetical protein
MKIHGVSADFVEQLTGLGYRDVSADDLVAMKIHGVDTEYIKEMNAALGHK